MRLRTIRDRDRIYGSVVIRRLRAMDAPVSRPVQRAGVISSRAILGGLHHHYARV
jgi:hypothetical protein